MEVKVIRQEMSKDSTFGQLYIDGKYICETLEDLDRGKAPKIKHQTAIPVGTYNLVITMSPRFKRFMPLIENVQNFEGVRIHCLPLNAEILTVNGWKSAKTYKGEDLYSLNVNNNVIEIVPCDNIIKQTYNGEMYSLYLNGKTERFRITDEHELLISKRLFSKEYKTEFCKVNELPSDFKYRVSGKFSGKMMEEKELSLYKIAFAAMADGSFHFTDTKNCKPCLQFHLVKERKINLIKKLLDDAGLSYRFHKAPKDNTTYILLRQKESKLIADILGVKKKGDYKKLPKHILSYDSFILKELLYIYFQCDGRFLNRKNDNQCMYISTTNENTLNILLAMGVLSGFNSRLAETRLGGLKKCFGGLYNVKTVYTLCFKEEEENDCKTATLSAKKYKGKVWCVQNRNRTIIVKYNNQVTIMSNCGNNNTHTSGCLLVGMNRVRNSITESTKAYNLVFGILKKAQDAGEKINITILRNYPEPNAHLGID